MADIQLQSKAISDADLDAVYIDDTMDKAITKIATIDSTPVEATPEPNIKDLQKEVLHVRSLVATLQNQQANDTKAIDSLYDTLVNLRKDIAPMTQIVAETRAEFKAGMDQLGDDIGKEAIRVMKYVDHQVAEKAKPERKDVVDRNVKATLDIHDETFTQTVETLKAISKRIDRVGETASRAWDTAIIAVGVALVSLVFTFLRK
jgi:hypothetical protein